MTLMPVTRLSDEVDCSSNEGASRWIGRNSVVLIGPASSIGWPTTFMMRPSVPGPTGAMIDLPVSTTAWPRVRPSVVSMAMVRTMFSPRCWATSRTRVKGSPVFWSTFWVSRAFRMPGRWPVNSTSTTAPMTWAILPWPATATGAAAGAAFLAAGFLAAGFLGAVVSVIGVYPCRMSAVSGSERFSAGDDLDQLGGDLGLAGTVVLQRQGADEVAGVARGVVHRSHLGAEEAGLVFQKGGQDLRRQVARQQGLEDVLFRRLVLIERAGVGRGVGVDFGRGQLTRRRDLRDHRLELAVEERDLVGLVRLELFSQQFGDRLGRVQAHRLVLAQLESLDDLVSEQAGQLVARLAADSDDLDVLAVGDQAVDVIARSADDVGREPARQTLVGRGDDDQVL